MTCMWERRSAYKVLLGRPNGKRSLGGPGVDGRIIFNVSSRSGIGKHKLD